MCCHNPPVNSRLRATPRAQSRTHLVNTRAALSWGLGHSVLFNYRDSKDQPCIKQDCKLRLNTNTPRVAEPKCKSVLAPRVTTSPCQKWKSERSARKRRCGSGAVGADERSARGHLDRLVDGAVGAILKGLPASMTRSQSASPHCPSRKYSS